MDDASLVRAGSGQARVDRLSVRLELQADCYARVWAHHADKSRDILEACDTFSR